MIVVRTTAMPNERRTRFGEDSRDAYMLGMKW